MGSTGHDAEVTRADFPDGFVFGVATSAYQGGLPVYVCLHDTAPPGLCSGAHLKHCYEPRQEVTHMLSAGWVSFVIWEDLLNQYADDVVSYCNSASTDAFKEAIDILRLQLAEQASQVALLNERLESTQSSYIKQLEAMQKQSAEP